jgi:phosphoglycerate dehydrogenase-like enzyme
VEEQLAIEYRPPEAIITGADILVNLLPYSPETKNYFHQGTWESCRQGAFLVSCGSGGTIDEDALARAVLQGRLAGAALDTYSWEPLPADSPLIAAAEQGANLLLTPHIAAGTADWQGELPDRSGDYRNLLHFLAGQPLEYQLI